MVTMSFFELQFPHVFLHSLDELVVHEKNGFIFENYKELADQLKFWFAHFNNNIAVEQTKEKFQRRINEFQSLRWNENWQKNALPVFKSLGQ